MMLILFEATVGCKIEQPLDNAYIIVKDQIYMIYISGLIEQYFMHINTPTNYDVFIDR